MAECSGKVKNCSPCRVWENGCLHVGVSQGGAVPASARSGACLCRGLCTRRLCPSLRCCARCRAILRPLQVACSRLPPSSVCPPPPPRGHTCRPRALQMLSDGSDPLHRQVPRGGSLADTAPADRRGTPPTTVPNTLHTFDMTSQLQV